MIIKQMTRSAFRGGGGRYWYVYLKSTKGGYFVDYYTPESSGESKIYTDKSSALRRFHKECVPMKKVIIGAK